MLFRATRAVRRMSEIARGNRASRCRSDGTRRAQSCYIERRVRSNSRIRRDRPKDDRDVLLSSRHSQLRVTTVLVHGEKFEKRRPERSHSHGGRESAGVTRSRLGK